MSSRLCNYCLMKQYRSKAKKLGLRITTKPRVVGSFTGGVDVIENGKRVAWFAELPDRCKC